MKIFPVIVIGFFTLVTSAIAQNTSDLTGVPNTLPCHQPNTPRLDQVGLSFGFFDTEVQLSKPATINGTRRDYVIVLEVGNVTSGSPAERVGLQPGDQIYQVRGIYFKKWCAKKQFETILGHNQKQVTVHYFTPSGSSQSVTLPLPNDKGVRQ